MQAQVSKTIDRRLARVEGQIRGLRRMVEQNAYCCDVLTQLAAVRGALDQVAAELATEHVRTCILRQDAHHQAQAMSQEELLDELHTTITRLIR